MSEYQPIFTRLNQAARLLGVSREWLRRAAYTGEVPSLKIGRFLSFHVSDVEDSLRRRARDEAEETRKMLEGRDEK